MEDNRVQDGSKENQVFLRDSDEVVNGWLIRTSHLVDRTEFIFYRHRGAYSRPDTPISGDRPFLSRTALDPRESEIYYNIFEDEDEESVVLRREPCQWTFPSTRSDLTTQERIVGIHIIQQERLLCMLHTQARGFYGDWQDTDVQEEDMGGRRRRAAGRASVKSRF